MLKHYLKIAFRNLRKCRIQSLIGIAGLAVGISFFAVGYYWIRYETSYDGFYPDSDRLYRLYGIDKQTGRKTIMLPFILGEKLASDFPEVEKISTMFLRIGARLECDGVVLTNRPDVEFVDEPFFDMFPPAVVAGRTDRLLHSPDEVVVTETFARKHWKSPEEAVGKVLTDDYTRRNLTIVAVRKDILNSNFRTELFIPDDQMRKRDRMTSEEQRWKDNYSRIFVKLHKNVDKNAFRKKILNYMASAGKNDNMVLHLSPITMSRHELGSDLLFNLKYIRTFAGAGILLLFCAAFNFQNLFLNRLLQRAREVRLRKVAGCRNGGLLRQFQTELGMHLFLAFCLGALILFSAVPFFEKRLMIPIPPQEIFLLFAAVTVALFLLLCLITISVEIKFIRVSSLSQTFVKFNRSLSRNISICVQLAICVFFLVSTVGFYRQTSYLRNFDWGFKPDGLIRITMEVTDRYAFDRDVIALPVVGDYIHSGIPIQEKPSYLMHNIRWEGDSENSSAQVQLYFVSASFREGFGIIVEEGRFFDETDTEYERERGVSRKVVINRTLATMMGKANPVGENLYIGETALEIIGVMRDIHITSLKNPVLPLVLEHIEGGGGYYNCVKVDKGMESKAVADIREVFKKHTLPGDLDLSNVMPVRTVLDNLSASENAGLQMFSILSALCIMISFFGIYSISSSNMERRRKEIAIRKIAGATTFDIVVKYLKEYASILIIANIVGLPFGYYFISRWLTDYTNRISMGATMFLSVTATTLALVLITVFFQVYRAANQNPAEVIKSE